MLAPELDGRRVRLLEAVYWKAAVREGNAAGKVKGWQLGTLRYRQSVPRIFHVEFDRTKPETSGGIFGVGGEGGQVGFLELLEDRPQMSLFETQKG